MKYYLIPKEYVTEINATNKQDAICEFATNMDTDMNQYFQVLTEEEYKEYKECHTNTTGHERFVINFMEIELLENFDVTEEDAHDVAVNAYDIYCKGDGKTEYECLEEAYDNWINRI